MGLGAERAAAQGQELPASPPCCFTAPGTARRGRSRPAEQPPLNPTAAQGPLLPALCPCCPLSCPRPGSSVSRRGPAGWSPSHPGDEGTGTASPWPDLAPSCPAGAGGSRGRFIPSVPAWGQHQGTTAATTRTLEGARGWPSSVPTLGTSPEGVLGPAVLSGSRQDLPRARPWLLSPLLTPILPRPAPGRGRGTSGR